ncbi:hypothetical protein H5410_005744 [Solanum commersonii]|uniref:Uncharacterized protein n=1 Tax=Solanum commersonii TaxID=4109 RepID=A0A9J6A794_SOLCO|nr:hypothetical protein H5410_005744 [Solanum commersonii]
MDLQPLSSTEYIILVEILFQQVLVLLICLFMATYGHSLRRRCQNRHEVRYRMSVRVPKIISHLHYIINDNGSVCIDKLRMDRNAFHTLVLLIKDTGGLTDSKSMSSSEKLAISGWSVSQAFNECLSAILKLAPLLLVNPKPVLADGIEDRWKWFKGCLGALDGEMNSQTSSNKKSKKSSNTTPSTRRTWIPEEEQTLLDGLKELSANGWRGDNGTFRPGHLMELERYIYKYHPRSGLKGEPHIKNKMRYWKRCYGSIALLKTRSGLGFQYSDGTIIVDDPKHCIDFIKIDPPAKKKNAKKWPLATGEFAKGSLDATEEIQKSQAPQHSNDMKEEEEENAYHSSKIGIEEAENATGQNEFATAKDFTEPSSFIGAENVTGPSIFNEGENVTGSENEHAGSRKSHKQSEYSKRSSSNVNEKEKSKKRKKIVEDDSETFLKGMMEVMKNFTESQDKRIGSLIEKMGDRDRSDVRGQVYSILESPAFELYTTEQRIKAAMILCKDDKEMELFLRMGEHDRQTMM